MDHKVGQIVYSKDFKSVARSNAKDWTDTKLPNSMIHVISFLGYSVELMNGAPYKKFYWNAVCDCGNEIVIDSKQISSRKKSSCGCSSKGEGSGNYGGFINGSLDLAPPEKYSIAEWRKLFWNNLSKKLKYNPFAVCGKVFGKILVEEVIAVTKYYKRDTHTWRSTYQCRCLSCGSQCTKSENAIRRLKFYKYCDGFEFSCGCLQKKKTKKTLVLASYKKLVNAEKLMAKRPSKK